MATVHLTAATPVAPARIAAALTDFSERRLALWPNIDPCYYAVHAVGDTWADVTEGSAFFGGVWERAHYDWSRPGVVTITVQASNAFATGSSWAYRIDSDGRGGSRIDFTLHRVGQSAKGRMLAALLRIFGRRIFAQDLQRTLAQLAKLPPVAVES